MIQKPILNAFQIEQLKIDHASDALKKRDTGTILTNEAMEATFRIKITETDGRI